MDVAIVREAPDLEWRDLSRWAALQSHRLIGRLIGRRLGGASDTILKGFAEHLAASVTSGPAPGDSWTESIEGTRR